MWRVPSTRTREATQDVAGKQVQTCDLVNVLHNFLTKKFGIIILLGDKTSIEFYSSTLGVHRTCPTNNVVLDVDLLI